MDGRIEIDDAEVEALYLGHLGLPSLAANVVGWFVYSRAAHPGRPSSPDTGMAMLSSSALSS